MTPAALLAAHQGNPENFLAAVLPGGIERQEKQGQTDQSFRETLPKDGTVNGIHGRPSPQSEWEALGFIFREPEDDIFVNVKFPEGWKKVCSDHAMHSDLVDAKGRKRAGIFYKAAFYDRNAHVYFTGRYSVDAYNDGICAVRDGNAVLHKIGDCPDGCGYEIKRAMTEAGEVWLNENYPDWKNPHAYWD